MKKLINSLLLMALMALTFNSCEDVPAPYGDPNNGGGGTGTTAGEYLNSPFSSDFGDFTLKNISGTAWVIDYSTAKATGYDNTSQVYTPSESYLVSKEIDLTDSKAAYLQFEYIYRYKGNGTENKVLITDNYTGTPTTTVWDNITGTLVQGSDWTTFSTYAKNLDSKYLGKKKVVVALYYASTDKASATIEIKNLIMKEGTVTEPEVPVTPAHDTTGAAGNGTKESPFNIPGANKYIADGGDANAEVYVKGKIVSITSIDTETYGNATYLISDDGTDTNQFTVFRGYALGNKHFTANDEIKVGDEVIVCGKLIDYNDTYEFGQGNYIYSLNGKVEETTGGGEGSTGTEMTSALIISGQIGDIALVTNAYGNQDAATPETWYTWKFNDIEFKGGRIGIAPVSNGGGIQLQGNATDAAKQGFIFNNASFATDIKTITLTLRVVSTNTFAPSYSLYAGTEAHPTTDVITPTSTNIEEGGFKVYTETFDLSAKSCKFFTIWNDKAGALYIDKVVVTLK